MEEAIGTDAASVREWSAIGAQLTTRPTAGAGLVVTDPGDDRLIRRLKATGLPLRIAEFDLCTFGPGEVVIVSPPRLSAAASARALFDRLPQSARVVVWGTPATTDWLLEEGVWGTTVAAILGDVSDRESAVAMRTLRKLVRGWSFGLTTMTDRDAPIRHAVIHRGDTRHRALERVASVVHEAGLAGRVASQLVGAVEGLILQALGSSSSSPLDEVELPRGREVRVAASFDSQNACISVGDVSTNSSLSEIASAVRSGIARGVEATVERELELTAAVRATTHLTVNVVPGVAREVICVVARGVGKRSRLVADRAPSLAIFAR